VPWFRKGDLPQEGWVQARKWNQALVLPQIQECAHVKLLADSKKK
jgi:D-hexose-6-phosphate mutarotase